MHTGLFFLQKSVKTFVRKIGKKGGTIALKISSIENS